MYTASPDSGHRTTKSETNITMNKLTRSPGHIWICMQTDVELFPTAFTANGYDTTKLPFSV
jgi:hypothetical protein